MKKINNYSLIVLAIIGLVLVRYFETKLFYDPLLYFFKTDFRDMPLPEMDVMKLMIHLLMRYLGNTVFSLMMIYGIFKEISVVKFCFFAHFFVGLILIILFFVLFFVIEFQNHIVMFYLRRFLIQPLLLMLFVPGIMFQRSILNKKD